MNRFPKTLLSIIILILFLPVYGNAYTDQDVKLFNAAQEGNLEKISALLDQGADINIRLGVDQWTPLMTAAREGRLEAVALLNKHEFISQRGIQGFVSFAQPGIELRMCNCAPTQWIDELLLGCCKKIQRVDYCPQGQTRKHSQADYVLR